VDRLASPFAEVLLADDASADKTAAVARSLGFSVIQLQKNRGPGGARNALARVAVAEWIHFHDVDDEIAPDYLDQLCSTNLLESDAILHFVDFIDETSRSLVKRWQFEPTQMSEDPSATLLSGPMPTMCSVLRRSTFLSLGGFNEQLRCYEDGDFHLRLAISGSRIASVPRVLEWSLRHDNSVSADQRYCAACRVAFLEQYAATLPNRHRASIAKEAEHSAVVLLRLGDSENAHRAIALARRLGGRPPTSRSPLLNALRPFLPAATLLKWQDQWRKWPSS
jgi:glycosyltransferase involved in cell wall biosynthesis